VGLEYCTGLCPNDSSCQASTFTHVLSFTYSTYPIVNRPSSYVDQAQHLNTRLATLPPKGSCIPIHLHSSPGLNAIPFSYLSGIRPSSTTTEVAIKLWRVPTSPHTLGHVSTHLNMLTCMNTRRAHILHSNCLEELSPKNTP